MKYRRCVRDYERLPEHHETYLYWSMITVMGRRVARLKPRHHSADRAPGSVKLKLQSPGTGIPAGRQWIHSPRPVKLP